jgi:hypothetical protein
MIRLIQQQAQIYEVPDLGTLYRWILEHRVTRQDLFSVHGMRWQAIGDRPDLERFFAAANALKGKKEPTLPRWDNMDVVPMEETPSTFEHQQFTPRSPLPDPSSPGLLLTDRVNQPNIPLQQPVFQERSRSPIEEQSVDMEMDSASEAGVAPAARVGLSFKESAPARRPGLVDVLPPLPNDPVPQEEEMPSSFPMDAPGVGEEASGPSMNFGESDEDPGSAVAIDSASSAGLDNADETLESTFLNSGMGSDAAAVQLQPVGKGRPPVIQMRQRRRRDDLSDEETQEAPSNIDALKVPPPPEPVLGPTPRVTISPEPPPARADNGDGDGDRATPGWVWAIAGLGAVVITIAAVLAWSQLNPPAPNPNNLKVDPTPAGSSGATGPSDAAATPGQNPGGTTGATGTAPPTATTSPEAALPPTGTPGSSAAATSPPPAGNPATTGTQGTKPATGTAGSKPPGDVKVTPPAPAKPPSGKTLVKQGWAAVEKGDANKARNLFDQAVQASPGNAEAVYGRGYASMKVGDNDGARRDFCRALSVGADSELAVEIQAGLKRVGGSCN